MRENLIAIILFSIVSTVTIVSAIYNYVILFLNRNKINHTQATIFETDTVLPEIVKQWNSKFVNVQYWVNGKRYVSKDKIRVAMNKSEGDSIEITYLKDDPTVIILSTYKKANIYLIIGIVCFMILLFLKYFN